MSLSPRKIFVLDTSVVLYDHNALESFDEHDVAIPITLLEELDQFKKGSNVINLNAREFIRRLDELSREQDLQQWISIDGNGRGRLRVVHDDPDREGSLRRFSGRSNDHRILGSALQLARESPDRPVILVTKDINLRLKARALHLVAEDYETVRVEDPVHLYTGRTELEVPPDRIDRLYGDHRLPVADLGLDEPPPPHHFLILRSSAADGGTAKSALAVVDPRRETILQVPRRAGYGIQPRNAEQTFAMHAILDERIPLVTVTGAAGTGKTLLALAGALEQRRQYRQIYLARPIVPLSNKDIGYLPGDIQSKVSPYMQPLWDNLGVIKNQFSESSREYQRIDEMVELDKLHLVPLTYIRGRSFANIMFIVDEAQNLTPHEVKTVITRAGEGTKIVFTGDIFQIDTPYLDAQSNGLSYLIDRLKGSELYAHVTLTRGERSKLANLASELL